VELLVGNSVVYSGPLGADRLQRDAQLGVSQHQAAVKARVTSSHDRTELVFFPMDPELSYTTLSTNPNLVSSRNAWGPFPGNAAGFLHQGGQQTYGVGLVLFLTNGPGTSVRGLYERWHGECEGEVKWQGFFDAVLSEIGSESSEGDCNFLFCPDYDVSFSQRVARSYLRQSTSAPFGSPARGGFGLHLKGQVEFDSPFVDDLSFFARALYDVTLAQGLPHFEVVGGPWANTWNCSASPFTTCPEGDVRDSMRERIAQAATKINGVLSECAVAPLEVPCAEAVECAAGWGNILGGRAYDEANLVRGLSVARAEQFRMAMTSESNWTCAPVPSRCAALTGAEATEEPTCQLKLRATSLVPMPDSFSLVWYPGDSSSGPVTAAGALYLALQNTQQVDQLADLCTPTAATKTRSFVRRSK
jgi:hypothetical protein